MDIGELMLTGPSLLRMRSGDLSGPVSARNSPELSTAGAGGLSEEKAKQVAKDFESLVIGKLFDQVEETIGGWGFEEDGASGQVQGLFWQYLARDVADKGGFGLWRDICKSLLDTQRADAAAESVDQGV